MKKREIPKYSILLGVTLLFSPPFVFANTPIFNPLDPTETIVLEEKTVEDESEKEIEEIQPLQLEPKKRISKEQVEELKKPLHLVSDPIYLDDELFEEVNKELPLPTEPSGGGAGNPAEYLPQLAQMVYLLSGTLLFGQKP